MRRSLRTVGTASVALKSLFATAYPPTRLQRAFATSTSCPARI